MRHWPASPLIAVILMALSCVPKNTKTEKSGIQSAIGALDYEDVESYIKNNQIAPDSPVISIMNSVAVISDGCTGWLITTKHLVTNQHCVARDFKQIRTGHDHDAFDQGTCDEMTIVFDKQTNLHISNYKRPPATVFHCARIVLANMALDLAIVEIKESLPADLVPLRVARTFTPNHQELVVVGQPNGDIKKISYRNSIPGRDAPKYEPCRARAAAFINGGDGSDDPHPYEGPKNTNSFVHDCDTIGGNSGSPVLDARTLEVVGLHWSGWLLCKWPHYDPKGIVDHTNQERGHGRETAHGDGANRLADTVPYRPGNTAINITRVRDYINNLPLGTNVGQVPAEVKAAFQ